MKDKSNISDINNVCVVVIISYGINSSVYGPYQSPYNSISMSWLVGCLYFTQDTSSVENYVVLPLHPYIHPYIKHVL